MKFTCPRCGSHSEFDEAIGDFPVRCHRCTALLRRKSPANYADSSPEDALTPLFQRGRSASGGLRRGMLAEMLGARPSFDEQAAIIHGYSQPHTAHYRSVLTPETRRVVQKVRARQQRVHRAMLEGSQRALGALGWVGLVTVVLLGISVLVLQAKGASHR